MKRNNRISSATLLFVAVAALPLVSPSPAAASPVTLNHHGEMLIIGVEGDRIVVRRWHGQTRDFKLFFKQLTPDARGVAIAVTETAGGALLVLTTDRYQQYSLWRIELRAGVARQIWTMDTDVLLDSVSHDGKCWYVHGERTVIRGCSDSACLILSTDMLIANVSSGTDRTLVLAGQNGLWVTTTNGCTTTRPELRLSLRGHAIDVGPVGRRRWAAIVSTLTGNWLLLLDDDFSILDGRRLGHGSWRLARNGAMQIASTPTTREAFEVTPAGVRRLVLESALNGRVAPAFVPSPVLATDGQRIAGVASRDDADTKAVFILGGIVIDAERAVIICCFAVCAILILRVGVVAARRGVRS